MSEVIDTSQASVFCGIDVTSEVSRLEEFAAEYPTCRWRVAQGPSSLCALELEGQAGRESFTALAGDATSVSELNEVITDGHGGTWLRFTDEQYSTLTSSGRRAPRETPNSSIATAQQI